jgi:hypothetical protein
MTDRHYAKEVININIIIIYILFVNEIGPIFPDFVYNRFADGCYSMRLLQAGILRLRENRWWCIRERQPAVEGVAVYLPKPGDGAEGGKPAGLHLLTG